MQQIPSVCWQHFSLRILSSPFPTSVHTRSSVSKNKQWNISINLSNHQVIKIYHLCPSVQVTQDIGEVQEIRNQPRACQSPDKILGTGKTELPGHHLIQRQQTGQWYIKSGLWHLAPTKNPTTTWLKVPVHKNIFFYPAKKKRRKVFFSNLNGQTSYQHLCRWLAPLSQPMCSG